MDLFAAGSEVGPWPLYATAVAMVIVGLLALIGTRWTLANTRKTQENEQRLSRYENWQALIASTGLDRDYWRERAERAEAALAAKETP